MIRNLTRLWWQKLLVILGVSMCTLLNIVVIAIGLAPSFESYLLPELGYSIGQPNSSSRPFILAALVTGSILGTETFFGLLFWARGKLLPGIHQVVFVLVEILFFASCAMMHLPDDFTGPITKKLVLILVLFIIHHGALFVLIKSEYQRLLSRR